MYTLEDSGLNQNEYLDNQAKIYREAELAKKQLSEFKESTITLPLYSGSGEQKSLTLQVSRETFENLIRDKVKETLNILDNTFISANLNVDNIDIIVLAGGTSLMPIVRDRVEKYFGKAPNAEKDAATIIAQGAAIIANSKWGKPEDGIREKVKYYEKTVTDFGVALRGRVFDCLISADTELPVRVENEYAPVTDNQENLRIEVFRRGEEFSNSNRTFDKGLEFLDEIFVSNLPPMMIHETKIKVYFELTKEDILQVEVVVHNDSGEVIESTGLKIEKSSRCIQL